MHILQIQDTLNVLNVIKRAGAHEVGKQIVTFENELIEISFEGVGIEGSCPAEKDNAGCYFGAEFRKAEVITSNKEFCDCEFVWKVQSGTSGKSMGKTLPAFPTEIQHVYPKEAFTIHNAAKIHCEKVLGTYTVKFER